VVSEGGALDFIVQDGNEAQDERNGRRSRATVCEGKRLQNCNLFQSGASRETKRGGEVRLPQDEFLLEGWIRWLVPAWAETWLVAVWAEEETASTLSSGQMPRELLHDAIRNTRMCSRKLEKEGIGS